MRRPLSSDDVLGRDRSSPTISRPQPGTSAPSIIEVDKLDADRRRGRRVNGNDHPSVAYLQYTSGSTRQPAGVMVSHGNILANFEQIMV